VVIPNIKDPVTLAAMIPQTDPVALFLADMFNIPFPFYVKEYIVDKKTFTLTLKLSNHPRALFTCCCGKENLQVHSKRPRTWQSLDFINFRTYIKLDLPRVFCPVCNAVRTIPIPWARPVSGVTDLLESRILALAKTTSITSTSAMSGVSQHRISRIIGHHVSEARNKKDMSKVELAGTDETAIRKGHNYISTFIDFDERCLLFATDGKDSSTLSSFSKDLIAHNGDPSAVKEFAIDMSPAFIRGITDNFPNAQINFDKFHVMKMMNMALDGIRRAEVKDQPVLTRMRYQLLKNQDSLNSRDAGRVNQISKMRLKTSRAYRYKLALSEVMNECCDPVEAGQELQRLISWGVRSRIPELIKFAGCLKSHLTGILRYFTTGLTSGLVESVNSKIQEIKRRSRGFPNRSHFINMLYLCLGKLKTNTLISNGLPVPDDCIG
jgi:transposase